MGFKPLYTVFVVMLCCFAGTVRAQFFNSKKYTIENSAAVGNILQVQQDATGAIWWVNDESFTRYNGIIYQSFSFGKLAASYRQSVPYIDENGSLWLCLVADKKADVYTWDKNEWKLVATLLASNGGEPRYFFAGRMNEKYWITIGTPTNIYTWENGNWEEMPFDAYSPIVNMVVKGATTFIIRQDGIYEAQYQKPPQKYQLPAEITEGVVDINIYENPRNMQEGAELWILTGNLIGYFKKHTLTVVKLFDNSEYKFTRLRSDGTGRVYLLSADNVLWQYETGDEKFQQLEGAEIASNENINQLFTDRENNLWLATEDGITKITGQSVKFLGRNAGLGSLPINAVTTAGDKVLAAGPKGISVLVNGNVLAYYPFTEAELINPRQRILDLKADSAGNMWLLSNTQGLWMGRVGQGLTKIKGSASLLAFAILPGNKVYAASEAGLFEATPTGLKLVSAFPDRVKPNRMVWHNRKLLLLCNKGIYSYENSKWEKLNEERGGRFDLPVYALYRVYDNLAILGTSNGIYYLKEFELVKYTHDSLQTQRPCYAIVVDKKGAVWLASDTGVMMLEKKGTPKIFAYRGIQFKESDASPITTGPEGGVWVAMRTGLMVYQPEYDKSVTYKPQVVISRIESQELASAALNAASISLGSKDNDITFYFDANSFIDEDKNKLLYKLEGYMTNWEEVTNLTTNSISFKNLPPGKYVLKMQLTNAGGVSGNIVSSPVITISRPFYNQWWFYAAVIAVFFAISFAVFYLYGQKKFENDLIHEVEKRSRELRSSEERFRTLWETNSDALALYNLRGEIILYNDTFMQLLGHTESLAGKRIYDVLEMNDGEITVDSFRQNLELQQLKPHFELSTHSNEHEMVLEFANTYLKLPNEKSWVMLSLIRNITQRKQTEENLIRAKNEAEQASRVKSAFLATMSHEIRTPLNAIIGMSSVMRGTALNDEQRNYVNAIKTSSDTLLSLVNNILDFSKIEAGMMMIEKTEVQPDEVIAESMEILGNLANEKGIYLYSRIHPDVPLKIISDKTRLRQVLLNLIGNAIKFTEKGYVEIAIRPDEDNKLKISVTDTGIGIPRQRIPDLFKVFTQVDDSTTRKYGGTGLGLAITEKLVTLLGGVIKIASQEGKGSQFTFTIEDFSGVGHQLRRGASLRKYPGVKAVLVSPDKAVANIFRSLNDERGIKTTVVDTPEKAAEYIEEARFVLMDVENTALTPLPQAVKEKAIIIKRSLTQSSLEIEQKLGVQNPKYINIPITSAGYQRVLEMLMPGKDSNPPKPVETRPTKKPVAEIPLKILVVDDNKVNLMMMEVIMKNLGYTVDFANNGREAVEKCSQNLYNLVFMDVQMPEMDGIEATRIIKQTENGIKALIVAITANAFPEDKQACLDAGMIDFLPKPVTVDSIKAMLAKLFSKEKQPVE